MRILFVDDDTDDKDIFFEALSDINPNIECHVACNGEEALRFLQDKPAPQFIFLDINMPIMDGKTFLIKLKSDSQLKGIPVVIYSTTEDTDEIKQLKDLGADYIGKPTSFEKLKMSLNRYLMQNPNA